MNTDDKAFKLVLLLNKLTQSGGLEWDTGSPPTRIHEGTSDVIPVFYYCTYQGQTIGLFERRYQNFDGEYEKFYWTSEVVLVLLDDKGRPIWDYSQPSAALNDLYLAVRTKSADIDGLLSKLVGGTKT